MSEPDPNAPVQEEERPSKSVASLPAKPGQQERTRSSRTGPFLLGALSGCLLLLVAFAGIGTLFALARHDSGELSLSASRIAIVPIDGEIVDSRDAIEAIHRYAGDALVRGLVIRINSPGGAIAPSQEIYEEIRKTRRTSGKPIVASLDSVAASGGFYIASACDQIVANPGSITGSIGVILQWMDVKDLVAWARVRPETITSGAMKAAGSPFAELTAEQRAYFQRVVSQLHLQFVHAVAEGRKGRISEAEVSRLADGRIFTGEEARALRLVDRLGNLDDAVSLAASLAGVKEKPATIYPGRHKGGLLDLLTNSDAASSVVERIVNPRATRFLYRW